MCAEIFSDGPRAKYFSKQGLQIFRSPTLKKEMAYDYKPVKGKATWLFIHGLGDDMTRMQKLAEKAEREGYGILRVDLFGHGESLQQYLRTHNQNLPGDLYYGHNIVVIQQLLKSLNVNELVIIGHSYGGSIAFGLAASLALSKNKNPVKVHSVHMLAPYVQRIDKFIKNYMQSVDFMWHQTATFMEIMGTPPAVVRTIMDPLFRMNWAMTESVKYFNNIFTKTLNVDHWQDVTMDPIIAEFMKKSYRRYFLAIAKKSESTLTPEENREIDVKVQASIEVTKGIRDFDLLDRTAALPVLEAPLQVIGGSKDSLVMPAQLHEFQTRMESERIPHKMDFIDGSNSHHLFPHVMADQTFQKIVNFQNQQPMLGN